MAKQDAPSFLSIFSEVDYSLFSFKNFSFHLFLAGLSPRCSVGFSLVVMHRLLIAAASLVAEHGPWGSQASVFRLPSSRAQAQ